MPDGKSLLQKTFERICALESVIEVVTVTNQDLFFYSKDEFDQVNPKEIFCSFLLEPFGKNSCAAIALASHYIKGRHGENAILLILPADHLVENEAAFVKAVNEAIVLANKNLMVTFGVKADKPETGYGYIQVDQSFVKKFIEKPDQQTAEFYLKSENYYWNSGMICATPQLILDEMSVYCNDISSQSKNALEHSEIESQKNWNQVKLFEKDFENIQDISIDYAVLEKSKKVAAVVGNFGWSDIGSWSELAKQYQQDESQNSISGNVVAQETKNCVIYSEKRLVSTLGINNLVIADTSDALLIADKNKSQEIKPLVSFLKKNHYESQINDFPKRHRPWGSYLVIQEGEGFKVKRIEVKPSLSLSLQSHKYRSEHWVVVEGKAKITNGEEILLLNPNQSTYIPVGQKHRLENIGDAMLVIIEVQCGSYLGEDDIIRYEDNFGRN